MYDTTRGYVKKDEDGKFSIRICDTRKSDNNAILIEYQLANLGGFESKKEACNLAKLWYDLDEIIGQNGEIIFSQKPERYIAFRIYAYYPFKNTLAEKKSFIIDDTVGSRVRKVAFLCSDKTNTLDYTIMIVKSTSYYEARNYIEQNFLSWVKGNFTGRWEQITGAELDSLKGEVK